MFEISMYISSSFLLLLAFGCCKFRDCIQGGCENIPSGYEAVSLIEALNGPYTPRTAIIAPESPDTPDTDTASAIQAAETLNRYV